MHTAHDRAARPAETRSIRRWAVTLLMFLALLAFEPALANKFETIGGGFSGSLHVKREWLLKFFTVAGGISLLGAVLAVVVPHRNALYLNYANWKRSALLMLIVAIGFFTAAALI
ncbi:MAG: hypothetical protein KDJ27_15530 [Gammaproteobacteria bacterium]|nr:hypothetical protein [Gammaproteobacteria bacterium]MCB1925129.1 hypothetical protein [Gammaproteobacteria bacterium]